MSGWWLLPAFVCGWLACWNLSSRLLKWAGLADKVSENNMKKWNHDSLIRFSHRIEKEIERRKQLL